MRDARIISSIGLPTRGWSVEDSERFFIEAVFQGEGTAIQQAIRGTHDPAYSNYTMGKLLIKSLCDDVSQVNGRSFIKRFKPT